MAVDLFLRIDGITGESTDSGHPDEIEVLSFTWGVSQAGPGGGAGAGSATFQDLGFVARTSRASPELVLACVTGRHINSAVLTARQAGERQVEFLAYTLTDVLASAVENGSSEKGEPLDQVRLAYGEIAMEYLPAGRAEAPVRAAVDASARTQP